MTSSWSPSPSNRIERPWPAGANGATGSEPTGFSSLIHELAPRNRALIAERERLQAEIDRWHKRNPGPIADMDTYKAFLGEIGYLREEGPDFTIRTDRTDPEICAVAGPQLVAKCRQLHHHRQELGPINR